MLVSSSKKKGKLLEKLLVKKLLDNFTELCSDDIRCTIGSETGSDIKLSSKALKFIPYNFECKSRATIGLYNWYEQAMKYNEHNLPCVVVFKANRKVPMVALTLDDFLELTAKNKKEK